MRKDLSDFFHKHPYKIFTPPDTKKLIIGTLPPPRFSMGKLRQKDVNFCYGSADNMLWPVLSAIFNLPLRFDNSEEAVVQRKEFLKKHHLGIADIVESCTRSKVDASDIGMENVKLRNILQQLTNCPALSTLIFMGGNTKNGPEYFFRKQLRNAGLKLLPINNNAPREHQFHHAGRNILTISLTSPSNAANRAIGSNPLYKRRKELDADYTTFIFRLDQYRGVFLPKQ